MIWEQEDGYIDYFTTYFSIKDPNRRAIGLNYMDPLWVNGSMHKVPVVSESLDWKVRAENWQYKIGASNSSSRGLTRDILLGTIYLSLTVFFQLLAF